MLFRDALEEGRGACRGIEGELEPVAPGLVVEEHDRVPEPAIKALLDAANRASGLLGLFVARQHNDGGILARGFWGRRWGFLARRVKGCVQLARWYGNTEARGVEDDLEDARDDDDPEDGRLVPSSSPPPEALKPVQRQHV